MQMHAIDWHWHNFLVQNDPKKGFLLPWLVLNTVMSIQHRPTAR
ncbi:hypothetical protein [Acidithiobacillus sp.]|nr:hypothetical protein [Acidithiobacillus sp.]MDA8177108.1 hypothetical protein [Acidithiobacillus sp.]